MSRKQPTPVDHLAPLQALLARWREKQQRFRDSDDPRRASASAWIEDCADELADVLAAIAKAEGR